MQVKNKDLKKLCLAVAETIYSSGIGDNLTVYYFAVLTDSGMVSHYVADISRKK
jgi:hypothetical protein